MEEDRPEEQKRKFDYLKVDSQDPEDSVRWMNAIKVYQRLWLEHDSTGDTVKGAYLEGW